MHDFVLKQNLIYFMGVIHFKRHFPHEKRRNSFSKVFHLRFGNANFKNENLYSVHLINFIW